MSELAHMNTHDQVSRDVTELSFDVMPSPIGALTLYVAGDGALRAIDFGDASRKTRARRNAAACATARKQLEEYFAGARRTFDLPLRPAGTEFQQQVWQALLDIPFGATVSYGEIAQKLGPDTSPRAVGAANGANPIPIIIPCHRVIGADGSLTGYGGGLHIKSALLRLESAQGSLLAV
jgi:methylated-DNA-[protein]-cysteine S-methyltransferase